MSRTVINAGILKDAVSLLRCLVFEAKLHFDVEGLKVCAVNASNVAMVVLTLDRKAFDEYIPMSDPIGIDLEELKGVLDDIGREEKIQMEVVGPVEKLKLRLRYGRYTSSLMLMDLASIRKEPKIPEDIELSMTIQITGSDLRYIVKKASKVSDHICFKTVGKAFVASAEGDISEFSAEIPEAFLIGITGDHDARSLYSIDYIEGIVKALGKCGNVTINLGNDYPMKMSSGFAGGMGAVTYMVAPRIESE